MYLSENGLANVPVVFQYEAVKGVKSEETGLDLHLLPPADHVALTVEPRQHQQLPHEVHAWKNLFVMRF